LKKIKISQLDIKCISNDFLVTIILVWFEENYHMFLVICSKHKFWRIAIKFTDSTINFRICIYYIFENNWIYKFNYDFQFSIAIILSHFSKVTHLPKFTSINLWQSHSIFSISQYNIQYYISELIDNLNNSKWFLEQNIFRAKFEIY